MASVSGGASTVRDDAGTELFSHQGVALKSPKYDRSGDSFPTGTLSIVQYNYGKWIEWKQTDVTFETGNSDAEWDVIDTVTRRRTCSSSSNADNTQSSNATVRMAMSDLKSYKIKHHGRQISLLYRDGCHFSFLFQCGNADSFILALRSFLNTRRIGHHSKNLYMVVNEREESRSLNKSFNELNLFPDQNQKYVWNFVRNLHNRPYETTMQTFSKLTDVLLYRPPEQRQLDDEVVELLTKSLHVDNKDETGTLGSDYTIVESVVLPDRPYVCRAKPLSKQCWESEFNENGCISDAEKIKAIIFKGGMEPEIRSTVWKYLLGYYQWDKSQMECVASAHQKLQEYCTMKQQWKTMSLTQQDRFSAFKDRKSLIEKDVNRTDRTMDFFAGDNNSNLEMLSNILMTYVMYNFDLGYVQGMSDLLAPILYLMRNEVDSFWCFAAFMERVAHNFDLDQAGMKEQLSQLNSLLHVLVPDLARYLDIYEASNMFFCFRWLLVLFKREFSYEETMTLWEVLWTDLPCKNFHLLICIAILDTEKEQLMKPGNGFSEILKHVNELSQRMNLSAILNVAEGMYYQLKEVKQQLPIAVQRIVGFAPPQDHSNDTDASDEEYATNEKAKVETVVSNGPPPSEATGQPFSNGQVVQEVSPDHTNSPLRDDIGFEGIERAIELNYF